MISQKPSFSASWKMLTRDKGWIKPLLVLTLVGWIPIVGQIAILGYALEWARLTAWGVESAPKQGKVDYGKIMRTGFVALLVMLSMGVALAIVNMILFAAPAGAFAAFPMTSMFSLFSRGAYGILYPLMLVVNLLLGTVISVAMMRAAVYDKFSAGWRLDRVFQMIGKDVGGFFRIFLVSLIGGLIEFAYSLVVGLIASMAFVGVVLGAAGAAAGYSSLSERAAERLLAETLLQMGSGTALIVVVVGTILFFIGGVIGTAVQLISINAVGQWFSRFDVQRWGLSSDPLPEGVPLPLSSDAPPEPAAPVSPIDADAAQADDAAPVSPMSPSDHEGGIAPYEVEDAPAESDAPSLERRIREAADERAAEEASAPVVSADDAEAAARAADRSDQDSSGGAPSLK
ncbi:MAG: DUF4013 domain-containing protein [Coriobacteriaceae bacterium]|nr:DUF4013 domain-containing protein [Coriobacteriaceae bacterium]